MRSSETNLTHDDINAAGKYAALLSVSEVGLGSFLHAWHIPFAGHFLSLNQGFILCKVTQACENGKSGVGFKVSMISSLLKSLSPAGKKLNPMLAISMQGFLFSLAQGIFGNGRIGAVMGLMLLSLWAFVQPVLIFLLIFGHAVVDVGEFYFAKMSEVIAIRYEHLFYFIAALVMTKLILAAAVALLSFRLRSQSYENFLDAKLEKFSPQNKAAGSPQVLTVSKKFHLVARDFIQPWFLVSLALTGMFFWFSEGKSIDWIWFLLRPLAVAFVVFYSLRFLPVDRWLLKIFRRQSAWQKIFLQALARVKGSHSQETT